MDDNYILKVSDLTISLQNHLILKNVSFSLKKNEIMAVIGPNGAGKTALFKALINIIPYKGTIEWRKNIKIGYVPQKLFVEADLPLTVKEFFSFKNFKNETILEAMAQVGFGQFSILERKLGVLSGGELQRILIAWAIIGNPEILLFDEPTSGIDINTEETIYSLLNKLHIKNGLTIMLISHELEVVYKFATSVLCLNKEKVCLGTPQEVLNKDHLTKLFGEDIGFYHHH